MADAVTSEIGKPAPFTPEIASSKQMQSEHSFSDDTPTDVNFNAVVARSQALTVDIAGKQFEGNSDRRDKFADAGVGAFKP